MSEASNADVSNRLARFVAETRWEALPAHVVHEAKRSLLNFFACALGGCRDDAIQTAARVMRRFTGEATATVIGRGEKSDALNAAFLNAAAANVFDFDDTHEPTIIHPTAPVAPALFAFAESNRVAGRDFLLAFLLGVDVECRIGNAISPGHYRRGWHITSTCGVFGGAAAVSKALGLSEKQTKWALGNASAYSGGLVETLGSMAKSISVGNAAKNGLLSALLAKDGFLGPDRPLEGPRGFLQVMGDKPDFARVTERLAQHWEITSNAYKPYPCGIVLNPVIEACIAISKRDHPEASAIERIEITGRALLRERTDRQRPKLGREAQVSAQHSAAVALTRGRATLADYTDAETADPLLISVGEKVRFIDDPSYPVEAARVTVRLSSGRESVHKVDNARGSSTNPLGDRDLEQKLRDLILFGKSSVDAGALIDAVWSIDSNPDAASVVRLAAGGRS